MFLKNGPFHFSATHKDSTGFGSCISKEVALKKAVNELIERLCFKAESNQLGTHTSNGFAAHDTIEHSMLSSMAEVIERDASLSCWLLKLPPLWLPSNPLPKDIPLQYKNILAYLKTKGLNIQIGILGQTGPFFTVCSVLLDSHSDKRFGFIYSSSSNKNLTLAIQSTILELSRGAEMLLSRLSQGSKVYKVISQESVRSSSDHLEYYLNPDNLHEAEWLFERSPEVRAFPFHEVSFKPLTPLFQLSWPIHVIYSHSSKYQNLYFGKVNDQLINFERLKEIANPSITKLNSGIHFLP